MKNEKPELSDKELTIVQYLCDNFVDDHAPFFASGWTRKALDQLSLKCWYYLKGVRACKNCGVNKDCEDLDEHLICTVCLPFVQHKCHHGVYHFEGNNEEGHRHVCSFCGKEEEQNGLDF